jgi:hypothetical protein
MARPKCSISGKDKFPSQLEAELAIADIHRSNSHHRHRKFREEPQRAYECDRCGSWHITSQSESENRASA